MSVVALQSQASQYLSEGVRSRDRLSYDVSGRRAYGDGQGLQSCVHCKYNAKSKLHFVFSFKEERNIMLYSVKRRKKYDAYYD